ncbi:bifunctional 2-C-methyl-D-erythritol 4-phosphate cytidylyltransferase/2-C-methyl-D-erythritol 2,4-cyclodiphosphate synthase [Rhodospirillum rubrum]|uniref:bifunctional 2-C-methyl-D-erythritol 4-phosphate cytidylyltransferase/2-C-methyl-D-erythritol 2,4-cyclodiphosphate synthase n=1 Tax=Rhodospirillum rubrum TaxID=1085 RepID=UPI00190722EA|nr:bifunctional 2-C-methyl-D-erythritol 4-phosphate cytidylyltransferase/2-C-methyl-D-erythritol 2,4-cyclodiphosphate synthase [Rhodospirillum rubrum]MBK1664754.1 bifunctional 2-C-methyl-D-erythritol 4-phosphate cytidylyltransferase/2-C-methyl-D-erythritol 2,4-cyclodiphosphate synthase [Rhodospirillum rubrum]MBK1676414.1 bifunctional 2-C-methyl-D-erythritol 4-phosphate cytidylyltransferase/2-C-methyl-D-erythritol 2,4-cyclodiphosphate synthase [Rhodospirillum rubrum]
MAKVAALIVAAGRGKRFGGDLPKQYQTLGGRPILRHTLARFAAHPDVALVRAIIHPEDRDLYGAAAHGLATLLDPVEGGAERQDSVRLGLESLTDFAPDYVLIHDGARPLVDGALIDRVIAALADHPGAIPALAVADTLKRGAGGMIGQTVDRAGLWRAQTPQGFRYEAILAAHRAQAGTVLTDDAAVLEAAGGAVALVDGAEDNAKITTFADLERAERLFRGEGEQRIGSGFDVHRLGPGDFVTLNGIRIPHSHGLVGHSDADAPMHALTDALLGCLNAGDIGRHFPPSDMRWKGADSAIFLHHAAALITALGGRILNVDITILCEQPKIGPHRARMSARLAEILEISATRVAVKATTTEELGFTGRGEGIAAQATALITLPF